jgi:uncharacterized protein (DUF486 family)
MKPSNVNPAVRALFVGWSILFLLYTMLGVWLGTGPYALAGPSTMTDDILSAIWLAFSVLQLVIAIMLNKHFNPWLFWIAVTLAILSAGTIFLPVLLLPLTR